MDIRKEAAQANSKLSTLEKVSYSFTDMAGNLLYVSMSSYILYFYTDVFDIPVSAAGMIILIACIVDAVSAIFWGSIVDHTHTKWGQSRPYFLWLAVPFALSTFLAFTAPNISGVPKLLYAGITYVLAAGVIYTGIQTTISAILPNLTLDPNERIGANSYRMVGSLIGSFVNSTFTLPLVAFFGNGNDKHGFMMTIAIFGVAAIVLLITAFKNMRERVPVSQKSLPFKQSLKATVGNVPWYLLVISFATFWIAQADRNSFSTYYAKYNLGNAELAAVFSGLQVLGIISSISIPFIVKIANKTATMLIGLGIRAVGQTMMALVGGNFILVIVSWSIGVLGSALAMSMPFAMLADTVDFGEWKTGVRAPGFLTAVGSAFCIQLGSGFGSFIPSKILDMTGFVANKTQTPAASGAINFYFIWLPVTIYAIVAGIMVFYLKYEKIEPKIKADLVARAEQRDA
ncbi:glycoside-pentoside-hexuronide (GPH):cation symporter [Lentilactobacillus buchneri]|uniref:glycoside-pentoside-hexuronide (GPH):cation symporter n=1 Tax=Lentilactobacillus buchneri TaxID=1581 RepID=UPI0020BE87A3|nr:MFS transporter [Lentilactobacillus buchneri]